MELDDVQSIETSGGLVIKTHGKTVVLGYGFKSEAEEHGKILRQWAAGSCAVQPSVTDAGLGIRWVPPQVLLESLLTGQSTVALPSMADVATNNDYLKRLLDVFGTFKARSRETILNAWREEPEIFRDQVKRFLIRESDGVDQYYLYFLSLGILTGVLIPGTLYILYLDSVGAMARDTLSALGLYAILGAIFCAIGTIGTGRAWHKKRDYLFQLKRFSDDGDSEHPRGAREVKMGPASSGVVPGAIELIAEEPKQLPELSRPEELYIAEYDKQWSSGMRYETERAGDTRKIAQRPTQKEQEERTRENADAMHSRANGAYHQETHAEPWNEVLLMLRSMWIPLVLLLVPIAIAFMAIVLFLG